MTYDQVLDEIRIPANYPNFDTYAARIEEAFKRIASDTNENLLVLYTSYFSRANEIFNKECFSVAWEYNCAMADVIKREILHRMEK